MAGRLWRVLRDHFILLSCRCTDRLALESDTRVRQRSMVVSDLSSSKDLGKLDGAAAWYGDFIYLGSGDLRGNDGFHAAAFSS